MGNLTFSILDLLLFCGFVLLFFRVKNNGFLREMVFITILFTYSYIILNNLKTVYDFFENQGLEYVQSLYNVCDTPLRNGNVTLTIFIFNVC